MYDHVITDKLDRKIKKLRRKSAKRVLTIWKKIYEVKENPYRYKILRGNMKGIRRVHIDSSFVLVFDIIEKEYLVRFLDYDHHDNVYG
jgi:YafQ family addiction module toxin component